MVRKSYLVVEEFFMGGFALSGLHGSERASMLPLGTLSLGLCVIA